MVKLNNNQINDALDAELGKENIKSRINKMKKSASEQNSSESETFSIDNFSYNFRTIRDAEVLKEGTSYSEHMLDLNELMEKGLLQRGNTIDLSEMPEIETIQAATQEQLDMLTPESKKQITAIHLSNNTPVGWDDNYDFDNKSAMDEKLDLSSYKNVTDVQTHFYVNNDLQDIVMPENATKLLCRHSKMENLQKDGGLQDIEVVLDRAETAFGEDDGYVDPNEERQTTWLYADNYFESGNIENIEKFKENGGDMNEFLHSAIKKGKLKFVIDAIENGADVNSCYRYARGSSMAPALVTAVSEVTHHNEHRSESEREAPEQITERRNIVKYLINQNAELGPRDGFLAPLQEAGGMNGFKDYETYKILAEAGSPLTIDASANAMHDAELFHILIENGYKPTAQDLAMVVDEGYLNWTSDNRDMIAVLDDIIKVNPEVVKELDTPENPIMLRAKKPEIGIWLMQHGADMKHAAENPIALNNLEYLKTVVENGADISDGKILRNVVLDGPRDTLKQVIKILLENGANPNTIEYGQEIDGIRYKENLLMSYLADRKPFDPEISQMLLDHGADANYVATAPAYGRERTIIDYCTKPHESYPTYKSEDYKVALPQVIKAGAQIHDKDISKVINYLYTDRHCITEEIFPAKKSEEIYFGHNSKAREILDILIKYGPENTKSRCLSVARALREEAAQDLEAEFKKLERLSSIEKRKQKLDETKAMTPCIKKGVSGADKIATARMVENSSLNKNHPQMLSPKNARKFLDKRQSELS